MMCSKRDRPICRYFIENETFYKALLNRIVGIIENSLAKSFNTNKMYTNFIFLSPPPPPKLNNNKKKITIQVIN